MYGAWECKRTPLPDLLLPCAPGTEDKDRGGLPVQPRCIVRVEKGPRSRVYLHIPQALLLVRDLPAVSVCQPTPTRRTPALLLSLCPRPLETPYRLHAPSTTQSTAYGLIFREGAFTVAFSEDPLAKTEHQIFVIL